MPTIEAYCKAYENALKAFDRIGARKVWGQASADMSGTAFIDQVIVPVLSGIGEKWADGRMPLSQVYMSGRISEELIDQVLPKGGAGKKHKLRAGIVTFLDYHSLGKKIVLSLARAAGYTIADYGEGLDVKATVEEVEAHKPDVLLVSTLMYPSALNVEELAGRLSVLQAKPKLVVGGAPFLFDDKLWQQVKADAMAPSASQLLPLLEKYEKEVV